VRCISIVSVLLAIASPAGASGPAEYQHGAAPVSEVAVMEDSPDRVEITVAPSPSRDREPARPAQVEIPEPMHFDLVRGLGAHAGELESNVLVSVRPRRGRFDRTTWAPEVEWAIRDGLAVELELPMVDRELHAFKAAVQWTAPSRWPRFVHGVQVIGEHMLDTRATELTALYLAGVRRGRLSAFSMAGYMHTTDVMEHSAIKLNPTVFADLSARVTVGLEGNVELGLDGSRGGLALGQVHVQVARRFRLQAGAGASHDHGRTGPLVVTRWIIE
jgi:hypothetical protein